VRITYDSGSIGRCSMVSIAREQILVSPTKTPSAGAAPMSPHGSVIAKEELSTSVTVLAGSGALSTRSVASPGSGRSRVTAYPLERRGVEAGHRRRIAHRPDPRHAQPV
jgi:hypothetical protein